MSVKEVRCEKHEMRRAGHAMMMCDLIKTRHQDKYTYIVASVLFFQHALSEHDLLLQHGLVGGESHQIQVRLNEGGGGERKEWEKKVDKKR